MDQRTEQPIWNCLKRIRLDNSGEIRSLQMERDKLNLGKSVEFTAPGTPQQNSVTESKIPALMGRARAMMIQAGLDQQAKFFFVKLSLQQQNWITLW